MKKMLNRALSVLFAILTIVSLCTSPIMAEEVETYAGCSHPSFYAQDGYSYTQYDSSQHIRNSTITTYCINNCGYKKQVIVPDTTTLEAHVYRSNYPTNDGSWTYQQSEYHDGKFHYYLYLTHCLCCGQAHTAYYFMKCTMCLPYPPF